jgi:para-nitrobenzyl esterase
VGGDFMPDFAESIFAAGKQHDVPMIIGTNGDEGTLFLPFLPYRTPEDLKAGIAETYGDATDRVAALYPVDGQGGLREAINQLVGDTWFVRASRKMLAGMQQVPAPAFEYYFTRQSRLMPALGAHHAAELGYVFNNLPEDQVEDADRKLADAMIRYWVQFARTGNPNTDGLPKWPEYDAKSDTYLELGDEIRTGSGLRKAECEVLEDVREAAFASQTASK